MRRALPPKGSAPSRRHSAQRCRRSARRRRQRRSRRGRPRAPCPVPRRPPAPCALPPASPARPSSGGARARSAGRRRRHRWRGWPRFPASILGAASRHRAGAAAATAPAASLRLLAASSPTPASSSSRPARGGLRSRQRSRGDDWRVAATGGGEGSGDGLAAVKERILPVELHKEATQAYMSYAMSVLGLALPDVCDGLKPVHRRILYAMHEMGLESRRPFRKCARVVGEVLGKFHPHEDTTVYYSLFRMAQGRSKVGTTVKQTKY